jgi:nucleoside-diphosphate-sugar epimerase
VAGRILVTGASGFVGRELVQRLNASGHDVFGLTRKDLIERGESGDAAQLESARWSRLMAEERIDAVVHLAARAHVVTDPDSDARSQFRRVNVTLTERLVAGAIGAGVRRLVHLSSIGVLGNDSGARAFDSLDAAHPVGPYAQSKWEAEQRLAQLVQGARLETVVIRPPLVYGPGVKGNFLRLLRLVDSGLPLPFAGMPARRSFLGLENLCHLISITLEHPAAAGQTLLAADSESVTLPELLREMGEGLGRHVRLFHLPRKLIRGLAKLARRERALERFLGSLTIDDARMRAQLNWAPPASFTTGIRRMTEWYLQEAAR